MDFSFTDEQLMLAETLEAFFGNECQSSHLQTMAREGRSFDTARWNALIDMGLHLSLLPEDQGGLGLSQADFVPAAETAGRACLPEPMVHCFGVAVPALSKLARLDARANRALQKVVDEGALVVVCHDAAPFVEHAEHAQFIIDMRGDEVHFLTKDETDLTPEQSADLFRPLHRLSKPSPASLVAIDARELTTETLNSAAVFSAAQMVGLGHRAVEIAADYTSQRRQFGKPVGSYQAVKHLLASAQVKLEFARPVVYGAAAGLDQPSVLTNSRVSQAKLQSAQAADLACCNALQAHGAMGYSFEVAIHFYLKRTLGLTGIWGNRKFHYDRIAKRAASGLLGADRTFA